MKFEDCDLSSITIGSTWRKEKRTTAEIAISTDPQNLKETGTDPIRFPEKETQTEEKRRENGNDRGIVEEMTITKISEAIDEALLTRALFRKLDRFHIASDVQLQLNNSFPITQLQDDELEVLAVISGNFGRLAVLIGSREHDGWCTHSGRIVLKHRGKIQTHSSGVCPSCAAFSSTGLLAVGNANGEVVIVHGEAMLSTNKIHSLGVSYLCWTSANTLLTTSFDGSIAQSTMKGNRLEIVRTKSLSVSDLPSKHRKASSSSKRVAIIAGNASDDQLLVATETGGLFLFSLANFAFRVIPTRPQVVFIYFFKKFLIQKFSALFDVRLFGGGQCSVSAQDGATRILSVDGTLLDAVRIEAQLVDTMNGNLLILSDREILVFYNLDEKKEVFREKLPAQAIAANSPDELLIVDQKNNVLCYKVARK